MIFEALYGWGKTVIQFYGCGSSEEKSKREGIVKWKDDSHAYSGFFKGITIHPRTLRWPWNKKTKIKFVFAKQKQVHHT